MSDLSWTEWAGVAAVGLALGYAGKAIVNAQETPEAHQIALLLTGTGLYVMGVGIGASRPEEGWIESGGYLGQIEG